MPRPLRIEFPGACYHVICRGNARLPIFEDDADKELLLDRMVHFAELFRIEVRAYCLMINHIHIHLRTLEANLGAYMRSLKKRIEEISSSLKSEADKVKLED